MKRNTFDNRYEEQGSRKKRISKGSTSEIHTKRELVKIKQLALDEHPKEKCGKDKSNIILPPLVLPLPQSSRRSLFQSPLHQSSRHQSSLKSFSLRSPCKSELLSSLREPSNMSIYEMMRGLKL